MDLNNKSLKYEWSRFKNHVSYLCLAGCIVTPWSLTLEVARSNFFLKFRKKHLKIQLFFYSDL